MNKYSFDGISTDDLLDQVRQMKARRDGIDADIMAAEDEIRKRCGHLTPSAPQPVMPLPQPYWPPNAPYRWNEVWCGHA